MLQPHRQTLALSVLGDVSLVERLGNGLKYEGLGRRVGFSEVLQGRERVAQGIGPQVSGGLPVGAPQPYAPSSVLPTVQLG